MGDNNKMTTNSLMARSFTSSNMNDELINDDLERQKARIRARLLERSKASFSRSIAKNDNFQNHSVQNLTDNNIQRERTDTGVFGLGNTNNILANLDISMDLKERKNVF